eukprot:scaffold97453_cov51-Phaeocystis_antarctica.AAC.1
MAARTASGPVAPAKRPTNARQHAASAGGSMGTRCFPSGRKTSVTHAGSKVSRSSRVIAAGTSLSPPP